MPKFRKKPVEIEAVQWRLFNTDELAEFLGADQDKTIVDCMTHQLVIFTLEGEMRANDLDWIIRGIKGELYPCKPDIFAETYEPV